MNLPNGWELILVLLVVVVVFGSKRLPDSARALGRSMRILKAETKGLREDDAPPAVTTTAAVAQPVQPVQPVQQQHVPPVQQPVQPVQQPVAAQAYEGQQLFDAQGRPVHVPAGSQVVPPASPSQTSSSPA